MYMIDYAYNLFDEMPDRVLRHGFDDLNRDCLKV